MRPISILLVFGGSVYPLDDQHYHNHRSQASIVDGSDADHDWVVGLVFSSNKQWPRTGPRRSNRVQVFRRVTAKINHNDDNHKFRHGRQRHLSFCFAGNNLLTKTTKE